MTKYFYMLMRKRKVPKKIAIRNTKPKFIRVQSGEFNFQFSDVSKTNSNGQNGLDLLQKYVFKINALLPIKNA